MPSQTPGCLEPGQRSLSLESRLAATCLRIILGSKQATPEQELSDFDEITHFSEQSNPVLGKLYYYKNKLMDSTFIAAKLAGAQSAQLSPDCHTRAKSVQEDCESMVLMYIGTNPKLPVIGMQLQAGETFTTFENFDFDLEFEIMTRTVKQTHFSDGDLWSLVYACISVLENMETHGLTHGNLCLKTVLIKNYIYKMIVPQTFGLPRLADYPGKSYHAPELRELLARQAKVSDAAIRANDVFSLGLLALEAGTLHIARSFYRDDGQLDIDLLNELLSELKARLPPDLYKVIREMLVLNPQNRGTAANLKKVLNVKLDRSNLLRVGSDFKRRVPFTSLLRLRQQRSLDSPHARLI